MKLKGMLLLLFLFQGIFIANCDPADNRLTDKEKAEGWKLLFDGKTMNGWRNYREEGSEGFWQVFDGLLMARGNGSDSTGYLISEGRYENFVLTFDWKISEGGNSGIFYHVLERPEYKVPYVTGPEYQVIDEIDFPRELKEWQKVGADYAMHTRYKNKKSVKKAGKWNFSKIVFDNGHVEHWLNGEKVVEFEAWTDDWFSRRSDGKNADFPEYGLAKQGHFSLQDHGSPVWYKNIKIKELPKIPKEESLFNGKDLSGWDIIGKEHWFVENGELICESGPEKGYGYLATKKYYGDFDLTVDFKQILNGNSGVFIRSYIKEGTKISGWQVEVAPQGMHTGAVYESGAGGRKWISSIPPEKEGILKKGEWNTMRIRVLGDNVTTWLNGERMMELNDAKVGQGHGRILLQIHDGGGIKVKWKNLFIKEIVSL